MIEGIAAKVGVDYDMGWYTERVMPGAFDSALKDDVRVLKNHDPNYVLGRTKSGTAEIYLTPEGHLGYRSQIPNRTYAQDLADELRSGDIDQSSWAFTISDSGWLTETRDGESVDVFEIRKVERLYDVSPVTYPANPDTASGVRALWEARCAEKQEEVQEIKEDTISAESGEREARLREVQLLIIKESL